MTLSHNEACLDPSNDSHLKACKDAIFALIDGSGAFLEGGEENALRILRGQIVGLIGEKFGDVLCSLSDLTSDRVVITFVLSNKPQAHTLLRDGSLGESQAAAE